MLFFALFKVFQGKLVSRSIVISSNEPWVYLSKFAAFEGTGTWDIRVKMSSSSRSTQQFIDLNAGVYIEHKWSDALSTRDCSEKQQLSKRNMLIQVPLNGNWSESVKGTFHQRVPYFWYFTLSSCNLPSNSKAKLKVELLLQAPDNSHFSAEDDQILYAYLVILIFYTLFQYRNLAELIKVLRKTDNIETHLLIQNFAVGLSVVSVILQIIHLYSYSYNGQGFLVFEAAAEMLESVSGLLLITLLLVVANGWTIKYREFPESEVFVPIAFVVITVNLVIVAVGRISNDDHSKNSGYEGTAGGLLVLTRVALWIWFCRLSYKSYLSSTPSFQSLFLRTFLIGSIFFLIIPFSVGFSALFNKFYRKKIILILFHTFQVFTYYYLTHSFTSSSSFYKSSSLSQGILPGRPR